MCRDPFVNCVLGVFGRLAGAGACGMQIVPGACLAGAWSWKGRGPRAALGASCARTTGAGRLQL